MSEMVRADHFELDVRPADASTEWVMRAGFLLGACWRIRAARFGGGPNHASRVSVEYMVGIRMVNSNDHIQRMNAND